MNDGLRGALILCGLLAVTIGIIEAKIGALAISFAAAIVILSLTSLFVSLMHGLVRRGGQRPLAPTSMLALSFGGWVGACGLALVICDLVRDSSS